MTDEVDKLLQMLPKDTVSKPGVHVPKHGDCLFTYVEDVPYRRVYVDPILTVFEAIDDDRLVGFQLKELSELEGKSLHGIGLRQNPPVIALLFESYKLDAEGVEPGWRIHAYTRAVEIAVKVHPENQRGGCLT